MLVFTPLDAFVVCVNAQMLNFHPPKPRTPAASHGNDFPWQTMLFLLPSVPATRVSSRTGADKSPPLKSLVFNTSVSERVIETLQRLGRVLGRAGGQPNVTHICPPVSAEHRMPGEMHFHPGTVRKSTDVAFNANPR